MRNKRQRNKRKTKYRLGDSERIRLLAIKRAVQEAPDCQAKIQVLYKAAREHRRQRLLPDKVRTARHAWERQKRKLQETNGICACCPVVATHRHHLIPLSYGGNPIAPENRVWICGDCHSGIHPHMETPDYKSDQEQSYQDTKPCWA